MQFLTIDAIIWERPGAQVLGEVIKNPPQAQKAAWAELGYKFALLLPVNIFHTVSALSELI